MTIQVEFEIAFRSGSDAFQDCPTFETARILREIAEDIERSVSYCEGNVRDVNGNTIGSFSYAHERQEDE